MFGVIELTIVHYTRIIPLSLLEMRFLGIFVISSFFHKTRRFTTKYRRLFSVFLTIKSSNAVYSTLKFEKYTIFIFFTSELRWNIGPFLPIFTKNTFFWQHLTKTFFFRFFRFFSKISKKHSKTEKTISKKKCDVTALFC